MEFADALEFMRWGLSGGLPCAAGRISVWIPEGLLAAIVGDEGSFLSVVFRQFRHNYHGSAADRLAARKAGCPSVVFSHRDCPA